MIEPIGKRVDFSRLHPKARQPFHLLAIRLVEAYAAGAIKTRFVPFSGYRSPAEQAALFEQRPRVTKADAWQSAHNYGLAVDFVPMNPGEGWSWEGTHDWDGLHQMAAQRGLHAPIGWDKAHIEHPIWAAIKDKLV